MDNASKCFLCPRECGVDRRFERGACLAPEKAVVARADLHLWEEPCICVGAGSGAVFFSGCPLKCVFCQNYRISAEICGTEYDSAGLAELFLRLQDEKQACNINLVSPTPHLAVILPALETAKLRGLHIPVVFNSSGYEKVETLQKCEGLIDIYLPDLKYFSPALSAEYSAAPDYFSVAKKALREMVRQTGAPLLTEDALQQGTIVRHLVLPGHCDDSLRIIDFLAQNFGNDMIILSLMSQYFPAYRAKEFKKLSRKLTTLEYDKVLRFALDAGFENIYTQSRSSASADYIPDFG